MGTARGPRFHAPDFSGFPLASSNGDFDMPTLQYRSSKPDAWTMPRPYQDASLRYLKHGPIQPMEQTGFFARLFGR
jgi:hypothetical protein